MAAEGLFPQSARGAEHLSLVSKSLQGRPKRGRQKTVAWPTDDKMCQVRLFRSEDAPSLLGPIERVFLHPSHPGTLHAHNTLVNEIMDTPPGFRRYTSKCARADSVMEVSKELEMPPGFHGTRAKCARVDAVSEAFMASRKPWRHTQKFVLDCAWWVAEGEDSAEVAVQQQREMRVLEAFYPRLTSIPDSPAESQGSYEVNDDIFIPQIPLIPVEDANCEEAESGMKTSEEDSLSDVVVPEHEKLIHGQKPEPCISRDGISHNIPEENTEGYGQGPLISDDGPKIAAAAVCMVVNTLQGSNLVDQGLLIEILRNPALIKSLTCSNQIPKESAVVANGNEVGTAGHQNQDRHNLNCLVGKPLPSPLNRLQADYGGHLSAGFSSPVSVLQKWAEEGFIYTSSKIPPKASETVKIQHITNVSSCMPTSLPSTVSESPYSHEGNVLQPEVGAMPGVHTWNGKIFRGYSSSHSPFNCSDSQDPSLVHANMIKDVASVPCQIGFIKSQNHRPSAMHSMQSVQASQTASLMNGILLHQDMNYQRGLPFRSLVLDAGRKSTQMEKMALGIFPKPGGRAKKLCMYYNTPKGCRNGGSCAFLHQSLSPDLNAMAQ